MTKGEEAARDARKTADAEWMMPNLASLPIRTAIDKLSSPYVKDQGIRQRVRDRPVAQAL